MMEFLLSHGSYLGIIVFMILTGAGLPLPEEVAIVAAGVLSSPGIRTLEPEWAFASCLFGALAGDCVMYWIGHHFGERVLREHHWWNRFVKPEREAQAEQMLRDHSFKVLFLARFLVGLRSPVYLSAGILRLPFRRFILIDLFCATIVIGTFFGLSYQYGEPILRRIREGEFIVTAVAVVVLITVGVVLWRRHVRRLAEEATAELAETTNEEANGQAPRLADEPNDDKPSDNSTWPNPTNHSSDPVATAKSDKPFS